MYDNKKDVGKFCKNVCDFLSTFTVLVKISVSPSGNNSNSGGIEVMNSLNLFHNNHIILARQHVISLHGLILSSGTFHLRFPFCILQEKSTALLRLLIIPIHFLCPQPPHILDWITTHTWSTHTHQTKQTYRLEMLSPAPAIEHYGFEESTSRYHQVSSKYTSSAYCTQQTTIL